eukprot:m.34090 g.34090  ORF g.34090 m.34090 type:complete len:67 (-) comp14276_c0_seq6:1821-2021(-)
MGSSTPWHQRMGISSEQSNTNHAARIDSLGCGKFIGTLRIASMTMFVSLWGGMQYFLQHHSLSCAT